MSSHRSRISQRLFPEACISGNRATAPFFLWMALHAARSLVAWLDRAERERAGTIPPVLYAEAKSLMRGIELVSRSSVDLETV